MTPGASISVALILLMTVMIFIKGFDFGTDFIGGMEITVTLEGQTDVASLGSQLADEQISCEIQKVVDHNGRFHLRKRLIDADNPAAEEETVRQALAKYYGQANVKVESSRIVSPTVSGENKKSAVKVVLAAMLGIILYLTVRFQFHYAAGALIAVLHDVCIMLFFILLFQIEFTVLTITAILTIVGYSVNDTIVTFDRIRENLRHKKDADPKITINDATNQVLSRTLITTFTTLAVVVALYLFSAGALKDFAFAMIVGLFSGTYSSIFIASGYLIAVKKIAIN